MLRPFHVICQLAPKTVRTGVCEFDGRPRQHVLIDTPLSDLGVSFESVVQRLSEVPRLYCEPDGSFVWRGDEQPGWQIDGELQDGVAGLYSVELRGTCPEDALRSLLTAVCPDSDVPWLFQLPLHGVWLDEQHFLAWATEDVVTD